MFFIMKKNLLFAALAVVAMASCTKNEVSQSTVTNEITFATPVLARHTKSTEITGTTYPNTASFNVYAWYNPGHSFDVGSASAYMSNVQVSHTSSINDDTPGDAGAWVPAYKYYWPKQGVLTFDAYSPNGLSGDVSATAAAGITVTNHVVSTTLASQQDFLYATRAKNKTSSTDGNNATYDGVDIAFNHALAVVKFTAKTKADYHETTTIKIKDIKIQSIKNMGTFEQKESITPTPTPTWSAQDGSAEYVALTADNYAQSVEINSSSSEISGCSTVIVLPQDFTASLQKLHIEYYLQTNASGAQPLLQTADLYFHHASALADENKWAMGKRYTYNIVIGLDEIYFAPSVAEWSDVAGVDINVN